MDAVLDATATPQAAGCSRCCLSTGVSVSLFAIGEAFHSVGRRLSGFIQVSSVTSSLSGGPAVRRGTAEREGRKIGQLSCGFRADGRKKG